MHDFLNTNILFGGGALILIGTDVIIAIEFVWYGSGLWLIIVVVCGVIIVSIIEWVELSFGFAVIKWGEVVSLGQC